MFSEMGITRGQQKAETRQRILEAAKSVFESAGFEKATMRIIAEKARVSPGSIIHHFKDKSELLYEVLYQDLEAIAQEKAAVVQGDPVASVMLVFSPYFSYYKLKPELSRVLLKESLFAEGSWQLRFRAQTENAGTQVLRIISHYRKNSDVKYSAASVISFYYFSILYWISEPEMDPEKFFRNLISDYFKQLGV
jgi:AcrR family transcriptional regulator